MYMHVTVIEMNSKKNVRKMQCNEKVKSKEKHMSPKFIFSIRQIFISFSFCFQFFPTENRWKLCFFRIKFNFKFKCLPNALVKTIDKAFVRELVEINLNISLN